MCFVTGKAISFLKNYCDRTRMEAAMKKSKTMMKRVLTKLETIYEEEDFLAVILGSMKNDYECEHLLRLIDKFEVRIPDNVLIIAVIISNTGIKTHRKNDYLKNIDDIIEGALLEESVDTELE